MPFDGLARPGQLGQSEAGFEGGAAQPNLRLVRLYELEEGVDQIQVDLQKARKNRRPVILRPKQHLQLMHVPVLLIVFLNKHEEHLLQQLHRFQDRHRCLRTHQRRRDMQPVAVLALSRVVLVLGHEKVGLLTHYANDSDDQIFYHFRACFWD